MYSSVKLNFSKFNKVQLLVSEQYIDSIMHGATIKVNLSTVSFSHIISLERYYEITLQLNMNAPNLRVPPEIT